MEADGAAPLPLSGLRILDLTAWWAGPAATNMLASLGAEVIHVESIQRPDGMRMAGGMFISQPQWWERSAIYLGANTNKRGLTLDLSSPAGREVVLRLIQECDAVVENFTPRVMGNFGLDWDTLHATNPRLILVRMPAFGLSGPWRDNTGFAQTMEQMTGLAWVTGYPDDQPLIQRGPSDPNAGMHAAFALLVALAEREVTGEGQHVEVTMIEAALNAAAEQAVEWGAYGRLLEREGNRAPSAAPQNLYACRGDEAWLTLSVRTDEQWEGLRAASGTRHGPTTRRSPPMPAGEPITTSSTTTSAGGPPITISMMPSKPSSPTGSRPASPTTAGSPPGTRNWWPAGSTRRSTTPSPDTTPCPASRSASQASSTGCASRPPPWASTITRSCASCSG